jgi:hypothetical protein
VKPNNNVKPTDVSMKQATNMIRRLRLRRERPFLNKLKIQGLLRSDVVKEATNYKDTEADFILKLRRMSISNAQRRGFIKRMDRDNLKQLEAEAQLQSDETNKVVTNNEEKIKIILATLPYIDEADKLTFQKRAKDGTSTIEKLINEAKKLNEKKRANFIVSQKKKFLQLISNIKLSNTDKASLQQIIDDKTNLNSLKVKAEKLYQKKVNENKNVMKQNLAAFMTPLSITQNYKNEIMSRFNRGENPFQLRREAKKRSDNTKTSESKTKKRDTNGVQLRSFLTSLKISQNYKNELISRFNKGENVTQLRSEAKKRDTNARKGEKLTQNVQEISKITSAMNLNIDLTRVENNTDLGTVKARILGAGKDKLRERAKPVESSSLLRTIDKLSSVKQLVPFKNRINTLITRQKMLNNQNVLQRKTTLKKFITNNTILPQNRKTAFIRRVDTNNNLDELRKEIDTEIRQQQMNQLKTYLNQLNVNSDKYMTEFRNTNISFSNIKSKIDKEVTMKGDLKSKKNILAAKIRDAKVYDVDFKNINTNVNTLTTIEDVNNLNTRVDSIVQGIVNAGKNALSNKIVESDLEINLTNVKTLKNLKNIRERIEKNISSKRSEISNYMKKMDFNNQQIKTVLNRKASITDSKQMANKMQLEKKRLELTKLLDEKSIPVPVRKQFYDKLNKNANVGAIGRDANNFMKNRNKNSKNVEELVKTYTLDEPRKIKLLNLWKTYDMTINAFKNEAKKMSNEYTKEKGDELRRYLSIDLKLEPNVTETIMKDYVLDPTNIQKYKNRGKTMKTISANRARIAERIRKAREVNGLNLKFSVNVKSENNVKSLNKKINQAYVGKQKKNLARRALNENVNISREINNVKTANNLKKLTGTLEQRIARKKQDELKKFQNLVKNMNTVNRNRYVQQYKNNSITFENVVKIKEEERKRKENREKEKNALRTYMNKLSNRRKKMYLAQINKPNTNLGPLKPLINANLALEARQREVLTKFPGKNGDWKSIIEDSKTIKNLNAIDRDLNKRIELRDEINVSQISEREKRDLMNKVMQYKADIKQVRENFVNKAIPKVTGPLVSGIINKAIRENKAATTIQAGFRGKKGRNAARRAILNKAPVAETFVPETNFKDQKFKVSNLNPLSNRSSAISAINRLKKISQKTKTIYKGQINRAQSNSEVENIKTRATRNDNAIRAREEEAKLKKKTEEAEAVRKKAEAAKMKKAEAMKRVMNASNAYVAAKKAVNVRAAAEQAAESAKEKLRRNAERKATMGEKSSYQAKINSRNFKIPKNRKKLFTSRIQRATTLGQVLKAYDNAEKERL